MIAESERNALHRRTNFERRVVAGALDREILIGFAHTEHFLCSPCSGIKLLIYIFGSSLSLSRDRVKSVMVMISSDLAGIVAGLMEI